MTGKSPGEFDPAEVEPHPGYFAADLFHLTEGKCKYLYQFRPIGKAGYSIFLFHITPEEADRARRQMGLPPLSGRTRP